MAHVYHVHTNKGRSHEVVTDHHHDNHAEEQFKAILLRVMEQAAGRVAGEIVIRIIYKGRR